MKPRAKTQPPLCLFPYAPSTTAIPMAIPFLIGATRTRNTRLPMLCKSSVRDEESE